MLKERYVTEMAFVVEWRCRPPRIRTSEINTSDAASEILSLSPASPRKYPPTAFVVFFNRAFFFHVSCCFLLRKPVEGQPLITPEQRAMVDSRGPTLERLGIEATNKQQVRDRKRKE